MRCGTVSRKYSRGCPSASTAFIWMCISLLCATDNLSSSSSKYGAVLPEMIHVGDFNIPFFLGADPGQKRRERGGHTTLFRR